MNRAVLIALLMLLPAYAGCLSDDEEPAPEAAAVAASAAEAGAKAGEAPVAPKDAYQVDQTVAYPVPVQTNAARAPVVVDFSGQFAPADCRPFNFGDVEGPLSAASVPRRFLDLSDQVKVGDVFRYDILVTYTNAPNNWGEIHPAYAFGSTVEQHSTSTQDQGEIVVNWTGQGFRASEDDLAWVFIGCWYGGMTQPIPYTYTVTLTFAEGAVPAQAPVLLSVPEGATKLIIRGVPIDASQGVLSHFRLFGPDDELVCECALSSADEVAIVPLAVAGDHVLIVDHTDNGFVSAALDVAPETPMRALASEWVEQTIFTADGGPVDTTVDVVFERVPLFMAAGVFSTDAGAGRGTVVEITNGRGTPLLAAWGGHLTWQTPGGQSWLGLPGGDWAYEVDHHAFAVGGHSAHIQADELRGIVNVLTRQYVR